eukprot:1001668-Prymnesium_polylepis.1
MTVSDNTIDEGEDCAVYANGTVRMSKQHGAHKPREAARYRQPSCASRCAKARGSELIIAKSASTLDDAIGDFQFATLDTQAAKQVEAGEAHRRGAVQDCDQRCSGL